MRLPVSRIDIHIADGIAAMQHFPSPHIQPHMGDARGIVGALEKDKVAGLGVGFSYGGTQVI